MELAVTAAVDSIVKEAKPSVCQVTQYAAVPAKIGAEKSKLLGETKLKSLLESKDLASFAAQLRGTHLSDPNCKVFIAPDKPKAGAGFQRKLD